MFIPRKLGTGWDQRISPESGATPYSSCLVWTRSWRRPATVAMVGDENAPLAWTASEWLRRRQTVSPVFLSSLTSELAAWT